MKTVLRIAALLSIVSCQLTHTATSEFRSPNRLVRGVMHFPLPTIENTFWYDDMPDEHENCRFHVDTWAAAYSMFAGSAYDPCACGSTTDTSSLSRLWFGKDSFRGEEIFAGGTLSPEVLTQTNPFLGFARITPRFDYNERGVVAGLHMVYTWGEDNCWHTGFRVGLPVKEIEIEHDTASKLEETLDDVVKRLPTKLGASVDSNQVDYAYRLDFLSSLSRLATVNNTVQSIPLVQYGNGNIEIDRDTSGQTLIGGQKVNSMTADNGSEASNYFPPVYLISATGESRIDTSCGECRCNPTLSSNINRSGEIPSYPFCKTPGQVTGPLSADGIVASDNAVLFFQTGVDYLSGIATNRDAQGNLFVVPRCDAIGEAEEQNGDMVVKVVPRAASDIGQGIESLVQFLTTSEPASEFFRTRGIDLFAHDAIIGVGDLDVEWEIGYGHYDCGYIDFLLGGRFPTGTENITAKAIYYKPTGNNNHYEIKLGLEGGWKFCDFFAARMDLNYHHAFKAKECRAIPFCQNLADVNNQDNCRNRCEEACKQACNDRNDSCNDCLPTSCDMPLRNIGPNSEVDVSWDYFVGHLDFTIFHPHNPELGIAFGYELMVKGHDDIELACDSCCPGISSNNTATDLLGRTDQPVCLWQLECGTKTKTHKLYADIFHRWNFFELYGGASYVIAGQNAMKETEAHLGMKIFF